MYLLGVVWTLPIPKIYPMIEYLSLSLSLSIYMCILCICTIAMTLTPQGELVYRIEIPDSSVHDIVWWWIVPECVYVHKCLSWDLSVCVHRCLDCQDQKVITQACVCIVILNRSWHNLTWGDYCGGLSLLSCFDFVLQSQYPAGVFLSLHWVLCGRRCSYECNEESMSREAKYCNGCPLYFLLGCHKK